MAVGMFLSYLFGIAYYYVGFRSDSAPWFSSELFNLWQLVVLLFLPIPVHLVGFVMGSVSLFFPRRKKLFPLLGMILNLVFGVCSLFSWLYVGWLGLHTGVK
jgi:4-hydroxybenzoate polyprenyltransferase